MPQQGLRAELREVEQRHPGWHTYLSDEGRCWAVTVHAPGDSGCTVDGNTPELLHQRIASAEHEWQGLGAA